MMMVVASYNKDGGEDDSGSASRGNWWKLARISLLLKEHTLAKGNMLLKLKVNRKIV
ncbi:unnamed protein product [Trifolium pratense]|uniref:Uncharacterized protein n=1 Tax=Trifolium pratense TaxID=57577 RepID=A0ACB0MFX2_TRIPR|nr:unnamed protein product [Trifolium pratense]